MGQTAREWIIVVAAVAALVACEGPSEPQRSSRAAAASVLTAAPAQSARDPSVPPAEAAQAPKSNDGLPASEAQADVTPREKDRQMPLPGQANDHSTPDFAKRGNDKPVN